MNYTKKDETIILEIDAAFENKTIQEFFEFYYLSKKHIHQLRMDQSVLLNNQSVKQNFQVVLSLGDCLQFPFFIDEAVDFIPEKCDFKLVYEDEFLLVIDKPPFLLVHPSEKDGLGTLVNGVSYYYEQTHQKRRVRYIHRLDVETSGLIVFVKTAFLHHYYDQLLKQKIIHRSYYAIVDGNPKKQNGSIEGFIARDRHISGKRRVSTSGEYALTHYQVIKKNGPYTLIECTLATGRTHQIRVHLSHIHLPIVGDQLYHPKKTLQIGRHALHAYKITLLEPFTGLPRTLLSPMPQDMLNLLKP